MPPERYSKRRLHLDALFRPREGAFKCVMSLPFFVLRWALSKKRGGLQGLLGPPRGPPGSLYTTCSLFAKMAILAKIVKFIIKRHTVIL